MTESESLVWVDLEMTGLDPVKDLVLEIAIIVTDKDLNVIARGPELVLHAPKEALDTMDEWCTKTHTESKLVERCLESRITIEEADDVCYAFVAEHTVKGKAYLAGNSVHMDKMWLMRDFPKFIGHLHYRIVDVSTIGVLAWQLAPAMAKGAPKKKKNHRALDDIEESIAELAYYKKHFFKIE